MKYIQQYLLPTNVWEHFLPFLFVLSLINGYLFLEILPMFNTLPLNAFGVFDTFTTTLLTFVTINVCCMLGYALSRFCILLVATAFGQTR